jgi:hypothetical protein
MKHLPWLVASFFLTCATVGSAWAESISVERWRGHDVLRLSGPIEIGLADELLSKLELADTWVHGAKVLLLDSPGGSVEEALRVSKVLDESAIHTVVPNYAKCASACGSIIFIAGMFRTVETFGAIGQHSCSRGGVRDDECNEELAMHGVAHGVSHGSIAAFITFTSPQDITWFSREDVDGWGLSRYPGEQESGFKKSEPRVIEIITGTRPPAQSAWRLDFMDDGYRAFLRPWSDNEREMQLNLFCYETLPGRLFLSMEINGPKDAVRSAVTTVLVATPHFSWTSDSPWILSADPTATNIVVEIPPDLIMPLLDRTDELMFRVETRPPLDPMVARTFLSASRQNLIFAANHCVRREHDLFGSVQ